MLCRHVGPLGSKPKAPKSYHKCIYMCICIYVKVSLKDSQRKAVGPRAEP